MPLRMSLKDKVQVIRMSSVHKKYGKFRIAWMEKFGKEPPCRKTIADMNKKFDTTGSVSDLSRSGRPKSSRTREKIVIVEEAIRKDPTKSLRALSKDLGITRASIHRIKMDYESNKNFLRAENKLLRQKMTAVSKEFDLEQTTDPLSSITITLEGDEKPDISKNSTIEENKVIKVSTGNSAVITFTPVNNHQLLGFPPQTYNIFEVQTDPPASEHMDVSQTETIQTCEQEDHVPIINSTLN